MKLKGRGRRVMASWQMLVERRQVVLLALVVPHGGNVGFKGPEHGCLLLLLACLSREPSKRDNYFMLPEAHEQHINAS